MPTRAMSEVKVNPFGKVTVTGVFTTAGNTELTVAPAGTPLMLDTREVDGDGVKVKFLALKSFEP